MSPLPFHAKRAVRDAVVTHPAGVDGLATHGEDSSAVADHRTIADVIKAGLEELQSPVMKMYPAEA